MASHLVGAGEFEKDSHHLRKSLGVRLVCEWDPVHLAICEEIPIEVLKELKVGDVITRSCVQPGVNRRRHRLHRYE